VVIVNGQKDLNETFGLRMMSNCFSYKVTVFHKNKWTWEKVYQLGRNSSDAGVRMECERLAVKIVKGIPLIENDIRYLDRTNANTVSKST